MIWDLLVFFFWLVILTGVVIAAVRGIVYFSHQENGWCALIFLFPVAIVAFIVLWWYLQATILVGCS
jgi:hypothetical protein